MDISHKLHEEIPCICKYILHQQNRNKDLNKDVVAGNMRITVEKRERTKMWS